MPKCELCPRTCRVSRRAGQRGVCQAGWEAKVALVSLHQWEEPFLSGTKGAGTVFFSNCNLRCVFCQNARISAEGYGKVVSRERLRDIFLEQEKRGATVLELVTPTPYLYAIIPALKMAKQSGLTLPVVYNTNGYLSENALQALNGLVDIYLPDFKYNQNASAKRYSGASDYPEVIKRNLKLMYSQVGGPVLQNGLLKRGLVVRHLVLPTLYRESCEILQWLADNFADNIYISLMNQYVPFYRAPKYPEINRRLTTYEYEKVVDYARSLGLTKVLCQERNCATTDYIPNFNGQNV